MNRNIEIQLGLRLMTERALSVYDAARINAAADIRNDVFQASSWMPHKTNHALRTTEHRTSNSANSDWQHIERDIWNPFGSEDDEMVYDWDGKEATCFQMYIEENKSLEEIMAYFKENHNFAPR